MHTTQSGASMEQADRAGHFCQFCGIRREELPPSENKVAKRRRGIRKAGACVAGQPLGTSPFDRSGDVLLTSRVTEDAGSSSDNYVGLQHRLAGLGGSIHFKAQFLIQDETSDMAAFPKRPSTTCCHHNPLYFQTTASRTLNFSRIPCLLLLAVGSLCQVLTVNAAPISGGIEITAPTPSSNLLLATPKSFNYEFPPPSYHDAQDPLTPATRVRRTSPQNTGPAHMGLHDQPQRLYSKHGFYIEIRKNGKVKGSRKLTSRSVMEIKSGGKGGLVAIYSKKSKRYLAMDKNGKITGLKTFHKSTCVFREEMIENNHFVYFKEKTVRRGRVHRLYLGFDRNGKPKRGKRVQRNSIKAHFLKIAARVKKNRGRRRVGKRKNKKSAQT